jgi:hypothetical protein
MKNRFLKTMLLNSVLLLSSAFAYAHGEDKPGPNGGYIRMPGAYHTEVIAIEPNRLKVYLLDINWKNPAVKDSSVKVSIVGAKPGAAECKAAKDHFICELPKDVNLNAGGTLTLDSIRSGKTGAVASYALPLSYAAPAAEPTKDEHHNHH